LFAPCGGTAGFERRREAFQHVLLEGGDNRLVNIRAPADGRRVGEFLGGGLYRLEHLLAPFARAIGRQECNPTPADDEVSPKVGGYLCLNADVTPGYGVAGIGLHTNKTGSPPAFGVGVVK